MWGFLYGPTEPYRSFQLQVYSLGHVFGRPRALSKRKLNFTLFIPSDKAPVMLYKEGEPLRDLHKYLGARINTGIFTAFF
jgi:hypothetical protein